MEKKLLCLFLTIARLLGNDFDQCGSLNSDSDSFFAISGTGDEDDIKAPWLAAIGKYESENNRDEFKVDCSGSILTRRHILTAAHCFSRKRPSEWSQSGDIDVRIGLSNLEKREHDPANIKAVTIHPDYEEINGGRQGVVNDFCIVTLDRDVNSGQVCLGGTRTTSKEGNNTKAVVIGFGKTTQSRSVLINTAHSY